MAAMVATSPLKSAQRMLRREGLKPAQEGYQFFLTILTRIFQLAQTGSKLAALDALRGTMVGVRYHVKRRKSTANLRRSKTVTDAQVRDALAAHATRPEQAKRLGITERQLFRRLEKLKKR